MSGVEAIPVVDEGLGNSAYLVDLGDGRALAVDASRDLRGLRATAGRRRLSIAYAADTHLHADFVTGATRLAAEVGATVLASAAGNREYRHVGLGDADEFDLGGLVLRALATPGHTHEHLAFELLDGSRVLGVFTGGSLLVGSAARTDLISPEQTDELTRAQYHSLRRVAELADEVAVWPTHGAGSFCSAPAGQARTSTIGAERATNPLLRADNEDAFVRQLLDSLGSFPPYFLRLGEINRRGPAPVRTEAVPALQPGELTRLRVAGVEVVDVRPLADFAAAHIPGSVSIALRPVFATWLGWLIADEQSLVIVRNPDQDPAEILWQARKIGYDRIIGELTDGLTAWTAAGRPVSSTPLVAAAELGNARILDVRQHSEFTSGHLPGAHHLELGDLASVHNAVLPVGPTVVMCGHGERAMSAASLLERAGHTHVAVLAGGPEQWADTTGLPLQVTA